MPCTSKSLSLPKFPQQGRPFIPQCLAHGLQSSSMKGELIVSSQARFLFPCFVALNILSHTLSLKPPFAKLACLKRVPGHPLSHVIAALRPYCRILEEPIENHGHGLYLVIYTFSPLFLRTRTNSSSPLHPRAPTKKFI